MSSGSGTLITDLDAVSSVSDTDLVSQILADMNAPAQAQPQPQPPMMQQQPMQQMQQMQMQMQMQPTNMINAGPMPNTILQNTIDPNVATAHIIGNRQPTPADFASLMGAPVSHPGFATHMPPAMMVAEEKSLTGFITNNWLRELKTPILVAIIFCVMSLPVMNVMIGHYFPRLLRIGGDLTMTGLGVKSLMAGALFFIIQRVLVPLVTN